MEAFLKAHGDLEVNAAVNRARRTRFIDYDWDLSRPENFPDMAD